MLRKYLVLSRWIVGFFLWLRDKELEAFENWKKHDKKFFDEDGENGSVMFLNGLILLFNLGYVLGEWAKIVMRQVDGKRFRNFTEIEFEVLIS